MDISKERHIKLRSTRTIEIGNYLKTVEIDIESDSKASRLELFIRIVWAIPTAIVLWFFGIVAGVCLIVHWFYILVTGKRQKTLNNVVKKYVYYEAKTRAYLTLTTEERSPIVPD